MQQPRARALSIKRVLSSSSSSSSCGKKEKELLKVKRLLGGMRPEYKAFEFAAAKIEK